MIRSHRLFARRVAVVTAGAFAVLFALSLPADAQDDSPRFKAADEMIEGWYHRHEHDSWIRQGADSEVIEGILHRIETTPGERSNPEWVDSMKTYGPGHWVYEWATAGEKAMTKAEAASTETERSQHLDAAITYFTTASWPHLGLEHDRAALSRARTAYLSRGSQLDPAVRSVEIAVDGATTRGFLHRPKGSGPFPLLIYTNGSDVTKESNFSFFTGELLHRGIALLTVDLPGIGESSHLSLLEGSETVLAAAHNWATGRKEIAPDKIFLAGASFGGHAAARAFFTVPAAGVVSMCGPLHSPFLAPPEVFDALPALTIDGVRSRLGILDKSNTELAKLAPRLSLQRIWDVEEKINTPLLVITTNRDPVAPVGDLEPLLNAAKSAETLVLDQEGHCPPRWVREPIVAHWVQGLVGSQ